MKCEIVFIAKSEPSDSSKTPNFEAVGEFSAKDCSEAAEFIKKYNSEHSDHTYYWRHKKDKIGIIHEDGICSYIDSIRCGFWDDVDEYFIRRIAKVRKEYKKIRSDSNLDFDSKRLRMRKLVKKIGRIRKIWGMKPIRLLVGSMVWTMDNLEYYLWNKWSNLFFDISFNIRNVRNFKKTGHAISEYWGLSEHMLGDLKYNLKKLIEVKNGVSFQLIGEVVKEEHKDDPDFDLDKWFEQNYSIPDDIHEKAKMKGILLYQHIIDLIDKYAFYGMCDPKPDKDYPNIVLEGSYDELDYKKMSEIANQCWNEIWDLVKKYGNTMWG